MSDLTEKQRHVINLAADVIDAHTTKHKLANSLRGILQSLDARHTQPAPVVAVKTWQERVKRTDDATAMQRRSIVARDEEIAELRAALAATAAPVLSDERIDWLANCACSGGIAYPSQVKTAIRDALREAATNRSQP